LYADALVRGASEQSAQQSRALAGIVVASFSAPVAVLDRQGTVLLVNQAWQQSAHDESAPLLAGVQPGINYLELCRRAAAGAAGDLRPVPERLQAVLDGRRDGLIVEWASPSGEHWNELHVEPLPGGSGGVLWHRDITSRKHQEAQTQQRYQEEERVGRMLMLGELAAALAHELNQPLAAILTNSQAAQRFLTADNPDLAEVVEILADINEDDKRAVAILNRIRAMMRGSEPELLPQNVNELIRDIVGPLREEARRRAVSIALELDSTEPWVNGDAVQLQQALSNLVRNALQAMETTPRAQRLLTIRTRTTAEGTVEMEVQDRGEGIPEDRVDQVFRPFYTTKSTGMGIGLAVTRSIVELHSGRLWATNNTGRGATFHLALPLLEERASRVQPSEDDEETDPVAPQPGNGKA
jgi:signal transduction histidine kinase